MCGIAGFTWKNEDAIKKMLKIIKHRGPDDEGIYVDENVSLGNVRLSILDLSPKGHQPMQSKEGNLIIVHNGEIYNYKEIREELKNKGYTFQSQTDTEVILYAYKEWGPECVKKFNGMWAFVIYDKKKQILFMSRDRFGIKPLYYYITNKKDIIFASEIKAILTHSNTWKPNELAIFDYLVYNLTDHQDFTFFKGIMKFPKAHYGIYKIGEKTLKLRRYWSLENIRRCEKKSNLKKIKEDLEKLLVSSVKFRLRSDVEVGSCLSGGVDSSSIVALMAKELRDKSKINTFSAVYPGFEKNEEHFIDLLVRELKVSNSKISPNHKDLLKDLNNFIYYIEEPPRSTSQYSQYNVMKLAAQHNYKVLLDGQGSDEMFAGYPYFYGYYLYDLFIHFRWKSMIKFIQKCRKLIPTKKWLHSFYFLLLPKFMKERYFKKRAKYIKKQFFKSYEKKSEVFKKIINLKSLNEALFAHVEYKLEELLKWEDRNSMAYSIETRVPFLDHRLVEFAFSVPSEYIINDCYTKYILRKAMEKYVPKEVIYRKDKVGFETPEAEWLRSPEIIDFVEEILNSPSFSQRTWLDSKHIKKLWEQHKKGEKDHSLQLWKVIFLELWYRTFIRLDQNE